MSAADFRHIAFGRGPRNCERVFRAAVSAYCTLERPTRQEIVQLDDLALGLFDAVSMDARRFAAAALSECEPAPRGLVRRLADEPLETAAPLLLRSKALSDVDLIGLIGRHGLGHARAIARRDGLNPVVAQLIRALVARAEAVEAAEDPGQDAPEDALEDVRRRLRALMRQDAPAVGARGAPPRPAENPYPALRDAALCADEARFAEALGRALGLAPGRARSLAAGTSHSDLLAALKALDLIPERAFLLAAAMFPAQLMHIAGFRLFLGRYAALSGEAARLRVDFWRREGGTFGPAGTGTPQSRANSR